MKIYGEIVCPCCGKTLKAAVDVELSPSEELLATYTVQKGDTLWGISQKFYGTGTKWKVIYDYNNLTSEYVELGQVLKIPRI